MFKTYPISEPVACAPATQDEFLLQLKLIVSEYAGCEHTPEVIESLMVELRQAFRVCYEAGRIDTIPQIYIDVEPFTRQVRVTTSQFTWKDAE
jgi:hypothetical protein